MYPDRFDSTPFMEDFNHFSHYEILGVPSEATADEIKRAYRQQVAHYHPDHYANASSAEQSYASERMQRINQAYDTLSDTRKRTIYDLQQPGRPRSKKPTPPPQPVQSRDYQAELYNQACEHLATSRYVQAIATLQELQRINPFYRDSATLLARARTLSEGKTSTTSEHPQKPMDVLGTPPANKTGRGKYFHPLISGLGAIAIIGILFALFVIPQFQTQRVSGIESPTTIAPTPIAIADIPSPPITQPEPTLTVATVAPLKSSPIASSTEVTPSPFASDNPLLKRPTLEQHDGGTIIHSYDFSTSTEWTQMQGETWSVGMEQGVYRIQVESGIGNIWSFHSSSAGTEYSVGVDVNVRGGSAGLALHFLDSNNYLAFLVDPQEGSYRLEQYHNGNYKTLADGLSHAIYQGQGEFNRIVAHLEGQEVRVFINGTSVATSTPDLATTDKYGLIASAGDSTATALFDNVDVRTLP
jgi:DnaJ-domain-containing protein 1